MAKRGRFSEGQSGGSSYAGIPAQIINQIRQQATGTNTSNTAETVKPNPNGPNGKTKGPMTAEKAAAKAERFERKRAYTAEEIAADPYKSMMKNALSTMTYEQALANFRKLQGVLNMSQLSGTNMSAAKTYAYQQAYKALTPEQKAAQEIFFGMGGSYSPSDPNSQYGGAGVGSVSTHLYNKYGVTAPTATYAPVGGTTTQVGNSIVTKLANPLSATQKTAIQRLRALSQSGVKLTATQQARFDKLKAIKNAPTIVP